MKLLQTLTLITWVVIMLVACGETSVDPLNGTTWELYSIGKYSPIAGSKTTIHFEDNQVSGLGGCNQYGGEYQLNGNTIMIDKLYMTEMACMNPEGIMEQERQFLQFLDDARSFKIIDGQLQISKADGEILTFVPAQ